MSVRKTKEMLMKVAEREEKPIISRVYELRFVKLKIVLDDQAGGLWVYLGRNADYLIIPGVFCSCKSFIIQTVINKTTSFCKHQVGVHVALKTNRYLTLEVTFEEAYRIVHEILNKGLSLTLRRKMKL